MRRRRALRPGLEVAREAASALAALLLAPARQGLTLARSRRRRQEFAGLRADALPSEPDSAPPPLPLRRLFLSCGDASGESHGLHLLQELRRRHTGLEVAGFGGRRLAEAGMEVWAPLADLNVMGFRDVAAQLPLFFRCVERFARELRQRPPQAVVLVDYPGLNQRLLRIAHRAGVPVVDFIAPQLWAWAPWRLRDFRRASRLLTILPFEGDWYRRRGADARYVGHPLGDGLAAAGARGEAQPVPPAMEAPGGPWVGLLPGSRRRELRENLPLLLEAARLLSRRRPELRFVLPHLRRELWPMLHRMLEAAPVPVLAAPGCYHGVLQRLQAAWVASGTALLEVAAHGVPPVVVYGLSSRTADLLRRHALAVPYVGSLNLMAGAELAPEEVGRGLSPERLARRLEELLDGPGRRRFLDGLAPLLPCFARPGASARAARHVEEAAVENGPRLTYSP